VIFTRAAREPDANKGFGPLPIKAERTSSSSLGAATSVL
jgi:hypothetical protein